MFIRWMNDKSGGVEERVVSFIGAMNDKSVEVRASGVVHRGDERQKC
ncbi:hypothetical protein [Metabacillus litoralis]|nr:hypothetical protein [Metabacillus litoralis]